MYDSSRPTTPVFHKSQHESNTWVPARVTLPGFVSLSQVGEFVMDNMHVHVC